jgi:hypothetical protein
MFGWTVLGGWKHFMQHMYSWSVLGGWKRFM